jgi:hypothetical protein
MGEIIENRYRHLQKLVLNSLLFVLFILIQRLPPLSLYYYVVKYSGLHHRLLISSLYITVLILYIIFLLVLVFKLRNKINIHITSTLFQYIVSLSIVFLVMLSIEAPLAIYLLSPTKNDARLYLDNVRSSCNSNISCETTRVIAYIDSRIGWSYRNPMSALEINNLLTPVDYWLLGMLGFSQAHVIIWQGWGSCGEHAILTSYLLSKLGYTTRIVRFKHVDHTWAEIYVNGTWYIVDPWYIGSEYKKQYHESNYLVPEDKLATLNEFSGNHRVICFYPNNTLEDCTKEHGYH